jgi:quinol monooxygenase YgiN
LAYSWARSRAQRRRIHPQRWNKESPMLAVVVEFRIKPEQVQGFHHAIVENARLSVQDEPGCHQFDVCCDPSQPTLFYLYELYDDEAAFQLHLQTAHFLKMDAATSGWIEGRTIRKLHRVQPR